MGEQWKQWQTLFCGGSKITADGDCSHEIKRCLLLGRKIMTNLASKLKSRDITLPTKVHLVKVMVFLVVMYGCESWTIKKAERGRIDAFELWCWWRLLRVPWTARRSNQSILKEISPEYSLEGLILKLKLQYFGHLMQRIDSLGKTLMLGKTEDGRRREQRGWHHHGHEWTWVWVNSGSWWWTGRPGMLQSMGSQSIRHNWATELTECIKKERKKDSEVAHSCPTLCNPIDCSPPGSSVHGILQARILEWVAVSFSRGSSQPRDRTWVSCITGRCFILWATREAHKT